MSRGANSGALSSNTTITHADATIPLLHSTKRLLALPSLPPYATDLVRTIVREVRERDLLVNSILSSSQSQSQDGSFNPSQDPVTACRLLVEHLSMRRGKRCLLAYHRARVGKIEEVVWAGREEEEFGADGGGGSAATGGDTRMGGEGESNGESNLSPEEEDYMRQYSELLAAVKGQWTDIDLTGSLEPPGDLFIDVRCIKDAGEVQTEYGSINLTKNSQFFVRKGDVERLIAQGYLQRLS